MTKRRRALLWVVGLTALAGLAGLLFETWRTRDNTRLLEAFKEAGRAAAFSEVRREPWDFVCFVTPYEMPSHAVREHVRDTSEIRFLPDDDMIDEGAFALVFVDKARGQADVFRLSRRIFDEVEGTRCVDRPTGHFRVEDKSFGNSNYRYLIIESRQP